MFLDGTGTCSRPGSHSDRSVCSQPSACEKLSGYRSRQGRQANGSREQVTRPGTKKRRKKKASPFFCGQGTPGVVRRSPSRSGGISPGAGTRVWEAAEPGPAPAPRPRPRRARGSGGSPLAGPGPPAAAGPWRSVRLPSFRLRGAAPLLRLPRGGAVRAAAATGACGSPRRTCPCVCLNARVAAGAGR